jgi:hypothetical protein
LAGKSLERQVPFVLTLWDGVTGADVAAGGGRKNTISLKTAYQQADDETFLKVVLGAGELREVR